MKTIFLYFFTVFCNSVFSQIDKQTIKFQDIDSNYKDLLFESYWEFDSILTKKLFGLIAEPAADSVFYKFNGTETIMCNKTWAQKINTSWVMVSTDVIILTFNTGGEATRWIFVDIQEDYIIVRHMTPKNIKNQPKPFTRYKKTNRYYYFKRVYSDVC